jgi:hypothetical protein
VAIALVRRYLQLLLAMTDRPSDSHLAEATSAGGFTAASRLATFLEGVDA